jgi:SpoVK/Ycf46/Vps4 family AAA+-type ATPase
VDDPVVKALRAALSARDDAELRCALGERLLQLGQSADARAEFEAALELQPSHARALEGVARTAPAEDEHTAPAGDEQRPRLRLVSDDSEEPQARATTFADVAGMEEAKQRLTRSFLLPLRNPDLVKQFGKSASGGLLLYGPPGCGKTFLARALAGEIGARFVNVGLQDVLDLWFGESERKLHELFENARRRAPTVLFFDEADALGQRRTALKGSAGRNLVNQLLSEMDGFGGRNDGVFFFAATNHPWDVDPALRRPGRFDRLVFVPPPDAEARQAIFRLKLEGRPVATTLDGAQLSRATEGFSGADIEGVCKAAAELALEASVAAGKVVPIDDRLLSKALRDAKASTRPWFEVARNHAVYANEGGVYDELLAHLRGIGLA